MVMETKKHPGQLKDEVASPAGIFIYYIGCLQLTITRLPIDLCIVF